MENAEIEFSRGGVLTIDLVQMKNGGAQMNRLGYWESLDIQVRSGIFSGSRISG